ncbi:hypothetical protein V2A60_000771 [Cordyceps javanica]|uniref:DNA 3'-5' helicase n=1 Tax=Cordyceps javanica TaxID=43265 RepID=A0A545V1I8_9HYPO|nr:DNA repair helicase RAD25 [Cordyceps javanica]TQW07210.1 DNA repair helicase RAD25 [Cordyceps javanica]
MPPERHARASGLSNMDWDSDIDNQSMAIQENIQKLDVSAFPFMLGPGIHDSATKFFLPSHSHDFSALKPRSMHQNRPLRVDGVGRLTLESFHPLAAQAQDLLVAIAEPVSRPSLIHEYKLTTHSLYAAVSVGLTSADIIAALDRFSKYDLPPNVVEYIRHCGQSYGMVRMVLKDAKYFLETKDVALLRMLVKDPQIGPCRVQNDGSITSTCAPPAASVTIAGTWAANGLREVEGLQQRVHRTPMATATTGIPIAEMTVAALKVEDDDDEETPIMHSFQIRDEMVGAVAQRCFALHYPVLEEYDFRNDHANPNLEIELRPGTQIRSYQEKSLCKMFGNGRARSGIIVLPCGAGKTLVGVTAACTIRKGVIVLATSNMSAVQWREEFIKWSNIKPEDVVVFSSETKSVVTSTTGIVITTYSMVTNTRNRAIQSAEMMRFLQNQEWGLMLLDEVHVVPAQMFRRVIGSIKAHSKLGLTATLLREDGKIEDLNFLIGPKLYEANWMELSQQGFIAKVQCAEVWCAMPPEFYEQYLKGAPRTRSILCAMNPIKFQTCQYLIKYHESRGDKIIVFSDNVYALEAYAKKLMKPFLHGGTSNAERQEILNYFKNASECGTLFLSKIGDTSLDLPEATCLIQISAQYGSRRQEAQRLGRVLRATRRNEEGFNAFFYSLVSKGTAEMAYASKRQAFLVNQGYAFRVITHLEGLRSLPDLAFRSAQAVRELLREVQAEIDTSRCKAEEEGDSAGLLTGGNMFYRGSDGRPARRPRRAAPGARPNGQHSSFFKAIARDKERRRKRQ